MNLDLSPRASEIVTCTQTLLVSGGYNGFSYADISASVHISKATIHHHFPSKAELVQTVLQCYRAQARAGIEAIDRTIKDPVKRLGAYTGYWESCISDDTASICVCAMLAAELPAIPSQVADEVRGHFLDLAAWLANVLQAGASTGAFQLRQTPEVEAMTLMATLHGAMLSARAYRDPGVFRAIVGPIVNQLSRPA
jgi:TetR/AcrR family transcriptional repressor of nem operon